MYLKNDKLIMTIDSLTFYSHNELPAPKYLFDQTALIGWSDGVDIKRTEASRPNSDGDFPEKMNFRSRVIIASGIAIANSAQQIHSMRDEFIGLFSDKLYKTMSITDTSGIRYATVSASNKPSWIQETDTTAVWKLELYAPDPYIYGYPQKSTFGADAQVGGLDYSNGGLSYPLDYGTTIQNDKVITNRGNATMWPVFIIRGDYYTGFTLSDNYGRKVTYNGMVTTAAPVLIDMAKGTATQSEVDKSTLLSDRDWISILAYESISIDFKPLQNGTGWCEVVFQDTWI